MLKPMKRPVSDLLLMTHLAHFAGSSTMNRRVGAQQPNAYQVIGHAHTTLNLHGRTIACTSARPISLLQCFRTLQTNANEGHRLCQPSVVGSSPTGRCRGTLNFPTFLLSLPPTELAPNTARLHHYWQSKL